MDTANEPRTQGERGDGGKNQNRPRSSSRRRRRKRKPGPRPDGRPPGTKKVQFTCERCGVEVDTFQPVASMAYIYCRECFDAL